ncbi:MAG TPA: EAL domain-containing protein [Mycobacteriales bacterium]|nr:EAL domain-containing protein [Mycobacteriales bacterium]
MVSDQVLTEVLTAFSDTVVKDFTSEDVLQQLVQGAVRALGLDGAGIMVPEDHGLLRFAFAAGPSLQAVCELERLQEQLQEGPCGDSHRQQRLINVADLALDGRWPTFRRHAVAAGLRAVATLPLQARGRRWGVLDLYRAEPRRLGAEELEAARMLAQVATSYLVVTADRDAARQAQQELAYRAMHDALTGLPVRWVFLEQLTHALARLVRHPGQVGVLFADLDGLKYVNDTYGHDAGDRLLLTCVERLRAAVRPTDVVARVGGDEFVVLLEDLATPDAAAAVARRILVELAKPYAPDGQILQPSASLGLALTADPAVSPAALVAHADSAMYRAKRAGRGRYELFDPSSYAADRARDTAREDGAAALRAAVRNDQLTLHYQPILELAPGTPDAVYALEALARWQHPARGLLTADEFIPQAERAGLLPELGSWVLSEACQQLAAWDRALGTHAPSRLFLNLSADELTGPDFPGHLAAVLRDSGISPGRLTLEITETGLIADPGAALRALAALHELGCDVAIDDFGTGYSSLRRLVELPVATWKIDRSFTGQLTDGSAAAAVVSAVLHLGRQLDRTVVVEGVENDTTVQALRRLGCTHAQGYHLGRPQPAAQIIDLLGTPEPAGARRPAGP